MSAMSQIREHGTAESVCRHEALLTLDQMLGAGKNASQDNRKCNPHSTAVRSSPLEP